MSKIAIDDNNNNNNNIIIIIIIIITNIMRKVKTNVYRKTHTERKKTSW